MLEYKSPSISSYKRDIEEGQRFDIQRDDFILAFGLENFYTGVKDDPRFVQWYATYNSADSDGKSKEKNFPMHKCTDAELAKFDPPEKDSEVKVRQYIKNRSFYCFDLPESD